MINKEYPPYLRLGKLKNQNINKEKIMIRLISDLLFNLLNLIFFQKKIVKTIIDRDIESKKSDTLLKNIYLSNCLTNLFLICIV